MADHKRRLSANIQQLSKLLVLDEVLPKIYVARIINKNEYDSLKSVMVSHGMTKAADRLLFLLTKKDNTSYKRFLSILESCGQSEVVRILEGWTEISPESSLSSKDVDILKRNRDTLAEKMDIEKVLEHLENNTIFWSHDEMQLVKTKGSLKLKALAVLDHVASGTYLQLTQLVESLHFVGQHDMARLLPVGINENQITKHHPESFMTQVTVLPAAGYNLPDASRKDVSKEITSRINDHREDVRKKLIHDYDLLRLVATVNQKQPVAFRLELVPNSVSSIEKIHADIASQHLAKVIKQYSHISDVTRPYTLQVELQEADPSEGLLRTDGATAATRQTELGSVALYRRIVHDMLDNKDYTSYDLWLSLRKHKGQLFKSPFDLSDENGLPLTHMCVDRGRHELLSVFLHMGWWTVLSRKKVPAAGNSLYKGMTCLDVAETKRTRKLVDEVKMYTEWEESLSSVMKSARSGDLTRISTLVLSEGESIHYRDMNNGNALYWAVISGDINIFKTLLHKGGLDPTMRTRKNETLLHIACMFGMVEFIPELIKCDIDVHFRDTGKRTALDRVAENGDISMLKEFVSCDIMPDDSFPVLAAYSGRKALLEYCLENKYHGVDAVDQYNRTPLLRAIEGKRVDIVKYLLSKGARLDVMPTTNKNVLHVVAESGSLPIFDLLVQELKKKDLLKKFINQRDRFNGVELCFLIRGRDKGRDAWHYVEVDRYRVPLFLKKTKSGNVDVAAFGRVLKSGWGMNPEQETIDHIEEMFKTRRMDVTAPEDCTPLHIAIFKENKDIARLLLESGADANIRDKYSTTPFMLAAAKNDLEMIQELEKYGAKINEVNLDGKNATDIAYENENDLIINYLGGRDHYKLCENFLKSDVAQLMSKLGRPTLDDLRKSGKDVKKHIIDTLRDFKIDINQLLLDIGSGPILEASEDVMPSNMPKP